MRMRTGRLCGFGLSLHDLTRVHALFRFMQGAGSVNNIFFDILHPIPGFCGMVLPFASQRGFWVAGNRLLGFFVGS